MLRMMYSIALWCAILLGVSGIAPVVYAEDTASQRKAAEQAADSKITELNKKMDKLAAEARHQGAEAQDEINRLYDEFKKKQGSADKDLEKMRKATNEDWEKVKASVDKSIKDLNGLYERAKSKEKGEAPEKTK